MKYLIIPLLLLTANSKAQTTKQDSAGRMIQTSARLRIASMASSALAYLVAKQEAKAALSTISEPSYPLTMLIAVVALGCELGSIGTLHYAGKIMQRP